VDILKLIKERRTIRKYKDKCVPKEIIDKIIEAGRWGPSIIGIQPWRFVVVENKNVIEQISNIILAKSQKFEARSRLILSSTVKAISSCQLLIIVYNTKKFTELAEKFGKKHLKIGCFAEIEAISASIENMLIVAQEYGIGSAWLDTPLFFENLINKLVSEKDKLVAILTFGYPLEKTKRSSRKSLTEMIKYIK
jgi:nitroreductase